MSKISMTLKQILDLGLWDRVCEYKGWMPFEKNNMSISDIVEFDTEFNKAEPKDVNITFGKEYCRKNEVYCIVKEINFEYDYEEYTKYLVSHRTMGNHDDISFELKNLDEISYILSFESY